MMRSGHTSIDVLKRKLLSKCSIWVLALDVASVGLVPMEGKQHTNLKGILMFEKLGVAVRIRKRNYAKGSA